MPEVVKSLQQ